MKKILVVGCGFSGSVIARELAEHGYSVTIVDKRNHKGGNAFDYVNNEGIRIHKYGPHIFHTNNKRVFDWLSRFTEWIPYKHKVKAQLADGSFVTLPVNKETKLKVGEENILNTFFKPYSEKMWGIPYEQISPKTTSRIAVRDDDNEFYFPDDEFQCMPKHGYSHVFENILNHELITVKLNTPFSKSLEKEYEHIFNSMPIDEYYEYCFGRLDYRSIKFHHVTLPVVRVLPVSVVNFTNNGPFTRITEWKNLPDHGINEIYTTLTYEEPCSYLNNNEERYYPIKDLTGKNQIILKKYQDIPNDKVTFLGRLGQYAYLDMHQCINSSLVLAEKYVRNKHDR
jgi:UDP-galactopyranose mutase